MAKAKKANRARPVLQFRVHEDLYGQLRGSAAQKKLTLSEEAALRIQQSFDWEKQFGSIKEHESEHRRVVEQGKEKALRTWGLLPVGGRDGLWVESEKIPPQEMVALNPALEALIERIVVKTLEKAKQS